MARASSTEPAPVGRPERLLVAIQDQRCTAGIAWRCADIQRSIMSISTIDARPPPMGGWQTMILDLVDQPSMCSVSTTASA